MNTGELSPALAALLGVLQGITEFLPISSSGHLSVFQLWLGIDASSAGQSFNIVVHAGTLLAVLWCYRQDIWQLLKSVQPTQSKAHASSRQLLFALMIATLPLFLVLIPGVEEFVIAAQSKPLYLGLGFFTTALLLFFSHRYRPDTAATEAPNAQQALVIGFFQFIAIMPGISRSGSTMAAGLSLGMERISAARFSFLLSIPTILAASLKETVELIHVGGGDFDLQAFAVGFICSFVVGIISLRLLLRMIARVGLLPFVPYLVGMGVLTIWVI